MARTVYTVQNTWLSWRWRNQPIWRMTRALPSRAPHYCSFIGWALQLPLVSNDFAVRWMKIIIAVYSGVWFSHKNSIWTRSVVVVVRLWWIRSVWSTSFTIYVIVNYNPCLRAKTRSCAAFPRFTSPAILLYGILLIIRSVRRELEIYSLLIWIVICIRRWVL